ncbi:hypothetical protein ACQPZJ_09225 [Actinoplanes sp. CA-054009]
MAKDPSVDLNFWASLLTIVAVTVPVLGRGAAIGCAWLVARYSRNAGRRAAARRALRRLLPAWALPQGPEGGPRG